MNEVTITLPKLYQLQQEIVDDAARFKVICAGRRVGKTILVRHVAINAMLNKQRVCYIAQTFLFADEGFDKIIEAIPASLILKQNKSNRHIQLITGGSIRFFSGEALNRTRGFEFDLIIVDEAAQIPDLQTEWNAALRPLLIKTKGKAYIISTPLGKNYFHSMFTKGLNNENGFKAWQFSSYMNPHLPKDELDEMIKEMPDMIYRQEILAEAMANAANPIGVEAINRNIITTLSTNPTVVYGIDVTYGTANDWTVICGLDESGSMTYFDRFQLTNTLIQHRIEQLPRNVLKVMDATAGGQVLFEQLQLTCKNIKGFKFTSESKPKIIVELIKDIEADRLKFNQTTANEMHTFQYKFTSTGHVKYEAQSGFHDDSICALAIANRHKNQALFAKKWKPHFIKRHT